MRISVLLNMVLFFDTHKYHRFQPVHNAKVYIFETCNKDHRCFGTYVGIYNRILRDDSDLFVSTILVLKLQFAYGIYASYTFRVSVLSPNNSMRRWIVLEMDILK